MKFRWYPWLLSAMMPILCCAVFVPLKAAPQADEAPAANTPELVLQIGHFGEVMALAFSPDNRLVASTSHDQTVKLWEARTGTLLYSLTGHVGRVYGVAFTPDSKTLYSVGQTGLVRAWDTQSAAILRAFPPSQLGGHVSSLWCDPKTGDTLLIATAYPDKSIRLEKLTVSNRKRESIATLTGHVNNVRAMAFSPDGKTLVSGDEGGKIKTWDTEDGSLQRNLSGHAMRIESFSFSRDGQTLADACFDGESFLYELKSGKQIATLHMNSPEYGVGAVAFSPDGQRIVTGGQRGQRSNAYLKVWDAKTYQENQELVGHEGFVSALAYSPDGSLLASGSRDHTIRLWDTRTGKQLSVSGSANYLTSVAFSPDGALLASGSGDRQVRIWNTQTGALEHILSGHTGEVETVAYSPDGTLLASGGRDGKALIWNARTGALLHTLTSPEGTINTLAFSPDSTTLAGGCGSAFVHGSVQVWDIKTEKVTHTLDGRSLQPVRSLTFTPDGSQIISASDFQGTSEVRFWDAKTGAQLFEEFGRGFHALALSSDGKTLITGGAILEERGPAAGDELKVWNAQTQTLQKTLTAASPGAGINALALLPDKKTVVSGSQDKQVRLWNIRTGETLRTFPAHPAPVLALALTAKADLLATVGADNTIRLWHLDSGKLLVTLIPLPAETLLRDPTDWMTVTPEGYYDGSAGAGRHIHWRIGAHLFSVEAFEKQLHRPDRLRRALDPFSRPSGGGAATIPPSPSPPPPPVLIGVPPQITFNDPQENQSVMGDRLRVKLTVTAISKITQVEVLANGRPIGAKPIEIGAKPIEIGAKPIEIGNRPLPTGHKNLQQFQMEVLLPPGESHIVLTARATDSGGLLAREELRLNHAGVGAANGNLYVLAVGVSHYKNPKYNLKYAAADAAAFGTLWQGQGGALYQKVEVTRLTDDQATSANIRAAFQKLQEIATPADSVAIFLSGHGVQANASDYYFAAQDIDASSMESVKQTGLPWTSLQTTLGALKARRVFLFLDACHSGNALGGQQSSNERMAELLVKQGGVMVFSSSRGSEFSYELEEQQHGAFTAAILEGIGQGKADFDIGGQRDGTITAEELLAYLRARVPQLTGNLQTPTCPLLRDFGEASPIARMK